MQEAGLVADGASCPAEPVLPRPGWPPLAGDYTVLRYSAPVAVCTLGDSDLAASVTARAGSEVAMVGTLTTENLGIERLVRNMITNPRLRFVIVCGRRWNSGSGTTPAAACSRSQPTAPTAGGGSWTRRAGEESGPSTGIRDGPNTAWPSRHMIEVYSPVIGGRPASSA
jgi:tetrahydromethanopterin S-methyltransferase subunit A